MEFELFTLIVTAVSLFLYYLIIKIELDGLDRDIQSLKQSVEALKAALRSNKRSTKSISFINDGGLAKKAKPKSLKRKGKSNG